MRRDSSISFKSRYIPFIFIVFIGIILRLLFYIPSNSTFFLVNDTSKYILSGEEMINRKVLTHPHRAPIYPFFLSLTFSPFGGLTHDQNSINFTHAATFTVIIQSVLGIILLYIFYLLCINVTKHNISSLLLTLFIAINPLIFGWERYIQPASLTSLWIICITFTSVLVIKKITFPKMLLITILFIFGFLLHPIYTFLPLIIYSLILLKYRSKRVLFEVSLFTFLYILTVIFYIYSNKNVYGYTGITYIGGINLIGKTLQYQIPPDNIKDFAVLRNAYQEYLIQNRNPSPYRFMDMYPDLFDKYRFSNLQYIKQFDSFALQIIFTHPTIFFRSILHSLPKNLFEIPSINVGSKNKLLLQYFYLWSLIYKFTIILTLTLLILLPYFIYLRLKKGITENLELGTVIILTIIISYQILLPILFSYIDYGRLIGTIQPLSFLLIAYTFMWSKRL